MRKYPRILFFINGPVPTPADFDAAEKFGPNCVFRNARLAEDDTGAMEICDGVAGQVPQRYADLRPTAEFALNEWIKAETERRERLAAGLSEAPDATAAPAVRTTPPADDKAIADGKQAAKGTTATTPATTPAPAASAGWKANS